MTAIHIEVGDLTAYKVDAIVNAANNQLLLGGGLSGAIARAGGPAIQAECHKHGPVAVGQAAITGAGKLPARHVIHQASMRLGSSTTADNLARSTRAVLRLAEENGIRTIAFPATGTGIGGFPLQTCAELMLRELAAHVAAGTQLTDVYLVLRDEESAEVFRRAMAGGSRNG